MDLFDSTKCRLGSLLPEKHRFLLLGLVGILVIITHDDNYTDTPFTFRYSGIPITQTSLNSFTAPDSDTSNEPPPELASTSDSDANASTIDSSLNTGASLIDPPMMASAEIPMTLPAANSPDFVTEVKSGDNLSLIFKRAGLTAQDVYQVTRSAPQARVLNSLYPGYTLEFNFDYNKKLSKLKIIKDKLRSTEIVRNDEGNYIATDITLEPDIHQVYREAIIDDSLFLAARRGGISASITMELASIFGGVIDFMLDTRKGDTFNILYEEKYLDGEFIGTGRILATQFTNQGDTHTAVRYVNLAGESDFYNPRGESMRKAFLRNPVDFTRISSGFSLSRKHPILNTIRAHKGTDYAAPRGTPVVAAGDGRVTWASRNGSFGKLVVIQHGERFQTKYAHLNDYANGIKKGKRIKQGQIIGYVGSTGGATGPHLHYEFLMDGVHRNSRTIHSKLPKAESVASSEMQRFREQTQILLSQLEVHTSETKNIAQLTANAEQ